MSYGREISVNKPPLLFFPMLACRKGEGMYSVIVVDVLDLIMMGKPQENNEVNYGNWASMSKPRIVDTNVHKIYMYVTTVMCAMCKI